MAKRPSARIIANAAISILLAIVLVAIMATALVEEAPHEYLGVACFVLAIAHIILNRRWFANLARGRWTVERILQAIAIIGLVVCLFGQIASSVVLSEHAFGFLPAIPGASWARTVHMLCSHWMFVFAFAHMGLQLKGMLSRMSALRNARPALLWVLRIIWAVIAIIGIWSFAQSGLAGYLFAQVQFAAADFDAPFIMRFARFASIAVLIAGVFHYARGFASSMGRTDKPAPGKTS